MRNMHVIEESDLVSRLHDPATRTGAFEELVRTYQRMLYFHIRRMVIDHEDADDVLQNTLLKAWKNIDRFRAESALKTWLYRIATNESLTFLNQKKRRAYQDVDDLEDDLRQSLSSGTYVDGDTIQHKLQQAILTLPERQRLVFNLRYYDELRYEEMADVLGVTVGALKASYHHAVKKVERYLEAN